ncbi:bifunctional 3-(3-hydroxy-phenyl)propionate/3-hydroxycinnamic acid hydroxylase [Streptomyces sp. NPDC005474]|uniref:bifunctional 3-(3-hydroxy-phenyl)propionate/3-hydroxycinnamic acid hydroxylase n=1 Tax=Streptomyces sp. NPDC005474 TaxID=3154878 RepID=UPI0034549B7E
MDTYDVVVIGYGPVGQMLSAQLGQAGHRVAAFERHAQIYGLSRAGHMDDEIVRTLQKVGAGEEFREDAVAWELYDMRTKAFGGDLLLSLDWSVVGPHGWRSHWIFYQNNLELALNRQVQATGNVDVHMDTEAVGFEQDADGVTVTVRDRRTGAERTVRGRYLVGTDGANSFVRRHLGISATPGTLGPYQLVIDTLQKRPLSFEFDNGQFADPERPGCLFQLGKNHRRWEFTLLPGEKPEDFDLDRVWELLEPWVTPEDVEVIRCPVYRFAESMTDEWQRGRIFLAGDAAHTLWPFAGEGMCNGIRDASTLAWRLDLVLRGLAAPALLDSYEADRKPNMQGWTDLSREIGLPCIITDPEIAAQRDAQFKAVQQDPSLAPPLPVLPGPVAFARAGDDAAGLPASQFPVRVDGREGLLDDVVGCGFHLVTDDPAAVEALSPEQRGFLDSVGVRVVVVGPEGSGAPAVDVDGAYSGWLRSIGRTAVLARPDFWLFGGASSAQDTSALVQAFADALAGRTQGHGTAHSDHAVTA